jgi:colanic acid biosynthesis protein WcaH
MSMIPTEKYTEIISVLPILCVDVVIQNTQGEYLLVKRINEPKKGHWWPVGGRVLKGETIEQAVIRKIKEETDLNVKTIQPIGYFELMTDANPFHLPFQYHTVSIVFVAGIEDGQKVKLDKQSAEWKYTKQLPADFHIEPFSLQDLGTFSPNGSAMFDAGRKKEK